MAIALFRPNQPSTSLPPASVAHTHAHIAHSTEVSAHTKREVVSRRSEGGGAHCGAGQECWVGT
jgi:hypothetical protein